MANPGGNGGKPALQPPKYLGVVGVGCIWFAAPLEIAHKHSTYFENLRDDLLSIENLTDLNLDGIDSQFGSMIYLGDDEADQIIGFPHIYNAILSFKLFIPTKIQEEIGIVCPTENFHIFINHNYHFPVTYILTSERDGESYASDSIVLVRKYLEQKFANKELLCGCIGPSPFHAEFFLKPSMNSPQRLTNITAAPGYRQYEFECEFDGDVAFIQFIERFGDTLSLFYDLQNDRSFGLDRELDVSNATDELLGLKVGFFQRLANVSKARLLVDRIHAGIWSEERNRQNISTQLDEARDSEISGEYSDLEYHFKELRRFSQDRIFDSTSRIASTFEARRQALFGNASILVGGLFGGILGALLTYLLSISSGP